MILIIYTHRYLSFRQPQLTEGEINPAENVLFAKTKTPNSKKGIERFL